MQNYNHLKLTNYYLANLMHSSDDFESDYPQYNDEQIQYGNDEQTKIVSSLQQTNSKINILQKQNIEKPQISKSSLPRQFHKAKRMLNKLIHQYFQQLKCQYCRLSNLSQPSQRTKRPNYYQNKNDQSFRIYLKIDKIQDVINQIRKFVGVTKGNRQSILNNHKDNISQINKNISNQFRNGTFSYLHEAETIVNLNKKGQISEVKIFVEDQKLKLPQMATPVPFKQSIYFFDASVFDKKLRIYTPDVCSYKISEKGIFSKLENQPTLQRIKCAITRDQTYIYLLGGVVGRNKLLTKTCQRYNVISKTYQSLPQLCQLHRCPSSIFHQSRIYIFSSSSIQFLSLPLPSQWTCIPRPSTLQIYSFQYISAISSNQLIIFGGVRNNKKMSQIQIYNIHMNHAETWKQEMPQPVSTQRTYGSANLDVGIAVISNIQARTQPDVCYKKNTLNAIYITSNGIFLHNIVTVK